MCKMEKENFLCGIDGCGLLVVCRFVDIDFSKLFVDVLNIVGKFEFLLVFLFTINSMAQLENRMNVRWVDRFSILCRRG